MTQAEPARTALLDAAERLFALHGIAQISDRRIADAAGNTNHSAVRYYFSGRDGLLTALLLRHTTALEEPRAVMFEHSDSLLGDVRSLVLPVMRVLARLPQPTWRARFLGQALHDPGIRALFPAVGDAAPNTARILQSITERLAHLDNPYVISARSGLITRIVVTTAADVEARAEHDGSDPRWEAVAEFLCDAIAGMLQAPITTRTPRPTP
ncbi:helix-turn-helix domain-containing protein [Actinoplanes sp. NPDC051861]|uniref:TetR/AcrR family transcriptional regulator n=1 Tax=Actinoplanes sp. NPDC051861 TaxID=3155170 RepID=UPI00341CA346